MPVGILSLELFFPDCHSLKAKRSRIKPCLVRLHKEFNISVAEMGRLDSRDNSFITLVMVCNEASVIHSAFHKILEWMGSHFPEIEIRESQIEFI